MKWMGVAAVLAVAALLGGCGADPAAGTHLVMMTERLAYEPATLTINAGETVEWKNDSLLIHTVTADPKLAKAADSVSLPPGAKPFNSGDILPGGSFHYTFTKPGTYRYFCIPHEMMGMIGTVVVNPSP